MTTDIDRNTLLIGTVICIVLIFIVYILAGEHAVHRVHRRVIDGYWDASAAFCMRSGVESAQALFRDGKVYLLIDEGDHVVLNKCVEVTLTPTWWAGEGVGSSWQARFGEDVEPLPQECELRLDPERGMMGFFRDDTLYLELFKNTKATAGVV